MRHSAGRAGMGAKHFGARITRLEDPALLTGRGQFVDDMQPARRAARLLRAQPARPRPHPLDRRARRRRAHARRPRGAHRRRHAGAHRAPAQIPMLVPNPAIRTPRTQIALARDEVCYVGQTVAVVVADSRYLAEDAAAAVEIDYEPLPAVERRPRRGEARRAARARRSCRPTSPPFVPMSYGDVDAAFKNAPHVFEEEMRAASRRGDDAGRPRACWRATIRRPTCSRCGRRRRRRISAAARWPTCSSAISNRSA